MKLEHIPQICNQSENEVTPQKPVNLRFAPLLFFFAFFIDIIDDIITYSPPSPNYVTITLANGSAVYWSRYFSLYHVTSKPHSHWWKFL